MNPTTAGREEAVRGRCFRGSAIAPLTLGVADLQELIGPVAAVDAVIVDQAGLAGRLVGHSELALEEGSGALLTVRVDSEGVFASRGGEGNLVVFPRATLDGPVVVAVVVHGTLAVEQETILALLQGQRTWRGRRKI